MVRFIINTIISTYSSTIRYHSILKKFKFDSLIRNITINIGNLIMPYIKSKSRIGGSNRSNCEKKIVVSLTSFPARINKVNIVIESLLNQTIKPDKIILWLSKEQFEYDKLPLKLLQYIRRGLEIQIVSGDLKSHKKYFYAFKKYPNDIVILVDDDIVYEPTFIETLIEGIDKNTVCCRYAFKIIKDQNGVLLPYDKWPFIPNKSMGNNIFFGTGGGSAFIPSSLPDITLNIDAIMELCPKADDVWLNAMVRVSGLRIKKNYNGFPFPIINRNTPTLYEENVGQSLNDIQIQRVNERFGNII